MEVAKRAKRLSMMAEDTKPDQLNGRENEDFGKVPSLITLSSISRALSFEMSTWCIFFLIGSFALLFHFFSNECFFSWVKIRIQSSFMRSFFWLSIFVSCYKLVTHYFIFVIFSYFIKVHTSNGTEKLPVLDSSSKPSPSSPHMLLTQVRFTIHFRWIYKIIQRYFYLIKTFS